jgi:SAM-dependent methyltransferase
MTAKPRTSDANSKLWGARARDWADIQEGQVAPVYEVIVERFVSPGSQYLDAGCGSGIAAQRAFQKGARVSGIDAAENMIAIARERVPDGDFHVGDLEALPFADEAFDLVTGFNSFQYAGNPVIALREAARVTKRGGHVVIMTWGPPEKMPAASLVTALRPLLPPPPPGAAGPFALSEEAALRALATEAGLIAGEIVDVPAPFRYPDIATGMRGLGSSGVATRAAENSGAAAVDAAHEQALAPFRQADGSYVAGALFRCLIATPGQRQQ